MKNNWMSKRLKKSIVLMLVLFIIMNNRFIYAEEGTADGYTVSNDMPDAGYEIPELEPDTPILVPELPDEEGEEPISQSPSENKEHSDAIEISENEISEDSISVEEISEDDINLHESNDNSDAPSIEGIEYEVNGHVVTPTNGRELLVGDRVTMRISTHFKEGSNDRKVKLHYNKVNKVATYNDGLYTCDLDANRNQETTYNCYFIITDEYGSSRYPSGTDTIDITIDKKSPDVEKPTLIPFSKTGWFSNNNEAGQLEFYAEGTDTSKIKTFKFSVYGLSQEVTGNVEKKGDIYFGKAPVGDMLRTEGVRKLYVEMTDEFGSTGSEDNKVNIDNTPPENDVIVLVKKEGALSLMVRTSEMFIPLGDTINKEEEIKKLQQDLKYYEGFAKSVKGKLSNEKFVSGAPAQVVENERKKLSDAEQKISSITEQLKSLL